MATQWQLECINALSTSPTAWDLFKAKQKNRKMLDQFINRLFPYKIINNESIKKIKVKKPRSFNLLCNALSKIDNDLYNNIEYKCNYKLKLGFAVRDKIIDLISAGLLLSTYKCNNNFSRFLTSVGRIHISDNESIGTSLVNSFLMQASKTIEVDIEYLVLVGGSNYTKETMRDFIHDLKVLKQAGILIVTQKNKEKLKKPKKKISNNLNIGIEIEYDGIETPQDIKKQLSNLGIREFDSGFDGNSSGRLRENRIRLDGIKGIKGLWVLLEHMKKDCALSRNSSVHMHIDCHYDNATKENSNERFSRMYYYGDDSPIVKLLQNCKYSYLAEIFNLGSHSVISIINNNVKFNSDFGTIEYRFCKVSLDYKDFILQMILLIHITECLKHSCSINKNLLMLIMLAARGNTRLKPFKTKKGRSPSVKNTVNIQDYRDSCNEVEIASETFAASNADHCQIETGCTSDNIINTAGFYRISHSESFLRMDMDTSRRY